MKNVFGGFGPEGGVEGTKFSLAADGAFDRAALEHFGREFAQQRKVVRSAFVSHLAVVFMIGDIE